ncbi:MAG TPA: glycosyltransferase family 4 protein [Solirubrobacteraceae bacterium]|nr:glycosyltransferase family 4 protein [Solirubrobacteraceae bacterium]
MSMHGRNDVWLVGSEDIRLRTPYLLELRRRGLDVTMVGSEPPEPFIEHEIPYHRYSLSRAWAPLADWRTFRELLALFREHRPSVVHAFDTKPAIIASFAARMAGVPVRVRTLTGMGYVFSSRSPRALLLRPVDHLMQAAAARAASITVFQNRDDQAYFLRHRLARADASVLVPGSGIDVGLLRSQRPSADALAALRGELGIESGGVVTMVSRLVRTKGVPEFCAAARAVRRERPDCTFLLVGPLGSEGWQAVSRSEVEGNPDVRWLGPRPDVPALLAISDVFALPTFYREGIPRALLEAAALGLPLIATDMPGCRDVVQDGWNGILVPPRNVQELTRALLSLLEAEPEALRQMGANSRAHVDQHFTLELVTDAYAAIYRRLLEQASRAQARAAST